MVCSKNVNLLRLSHLDVGGQGLERKLVPVPLLSHDLVRHDLGIELDKHHLELLGAHDLLLDKGLSQVVEKVHVCAEDVLSGEVRVVDQPLDLGVGLSHNLASP